MNTFRILFLAAGIALAGCASHQWVQNGKTEDDAYAALNACEQIRPEPQPEPPLYLPKRQFPDQAYLLKCMGDKGYRLVEKK